LTDLKKSSPLKPLGQMNQTIGFRGEDFLESTNQKQELPVAVMFVNGSGRNEPSDGKSSHC
jgi:hypothetical protein